MEAVNGTWLNARGAGAILQLIRSQPRITRAELVAGSGMSRSTVTHRLEQLLANGLITDVEGASTGGRRPSVFAFAPRSGMILAAGMGATSTRLAVTDLGGTVLAERAAELDVAPGPESVLSWMKEEWSELLAEAGATAGQVRGVGLGIPAPVEAATGTPVLPPIMPGWDGFAIPDYLRQTYDVPVLVDNDVNVMALGEQRAFHRDVPTVIFLKIGTGIGLGIVSDHRIHRGADGSAGDLGHIHTSAADDVLCRCGKFGCLEAVASGGAIARRLRDQGIEARTTRDVVALCRSGDMQAIELVRESGKLIGEALASAVNLLNPRVIVIGGDLAQAEEHLMPGIRELVYQRSISLATRQLRIVRSRLNDAAGVAGAAMMVVDHLLSPDKIDELVAD